MDPLAAPIIPGLTEGAQGTPENQTLYAIVAMWRDNRKQAEKFLNLATKMFTPRDPTPEPMLTGLQPPVGFYGGQGVPPPLGQLPGPMGY